MGMQLNRSVEHPENDPSSVRQTRVGTVVQGTMQCVTREGKGREEKGKGKGREEKGREGKRREGKMKKEIGEKAHYRSGFVF